MQECDTVLNKPFKNGCNSAFRVYLNEDFNKWDNTDANERTEFWVPNLSMTGIKPLLYKFIQCGLANVTNWKRSLVHIT